VDGFWFAKSNQRLISITSSTIRGVKPRLFALSLCAIAGLAVSVRADTSLSGICPDGSFFIVQTRAAIPCKNARLADPSELPPVRPYLLPKPYTWYVDQEARNPNNPYNVLETAQRIRDARAGIPSDGGTPQRAPGEAPKATRSLPAPQGAQLGPPQAPAAAPVALGDSDLRDLVRLVALRQQEAPAKLEIQNAHGQKSLELEVAYSAAFEGFALQQLGRRAGESRVLVWTARAERDADFHPNFFVVQGGRTFRPDPEKASEIGFLLGAAGTLPGGEMAVGYLVMPASFDPTASLDVFWNDRSVSAVLARPVTASR
jgi:hypothetical protein